MDKSKGGNSKTYRQHNRGLILKLIAAGICTSRADLARYTGLTKMAVTNIVSEMLEQQFIQESSIVSNEEVGRNPIRLGISDQCPKAIGILIYRERLEAVLCDFRLNIIERTYRDMKEIDTQEAMMQALYVMIDGLLEKESNVLGIGVSSIGPVDNQKGEILEPLYFQQIKNVPVSRLLKERYELPICLNHDNHCGALAELLYGGGSAYGDFLFVGLGRGIGCAMVLNGEMYENQGGLASELGHTSINYEGSLCTCGNRGCIEHYASSAVMLERLRRETSGDDSFQQFCARYEEEKVKAIFDDVMRKLSCALVNYINILNPELIRLGHDAVLLPEGCIQLLEEEVNRLRFFCYGGRIKVQKAYFGKDAQVLGGACLIIKEAFSGKLLFNK